MRAVPTVSTAEGEARVATGAKAAWDAGHTLENDHRNLLRASYDDLPRAQHRLHSLGYDMDADLSTDEAKVAVHRASGRPLVLHRGSTTSADWLVSDALIAAGRADAHDPRHARARKITEITRRKYGQPVSAIGHSLGGRLAAQSGAKGRILGVDPAVGIGDAFKRRGDNHTVIRSPDDVVSALGVTQRGGQVKHKRGYAKKGSAADFLLGGLPINPIEAHRF